MRVVVVVPALDEAGNIGPLVTALLAQPVDGVVVADNGSTDATAAEAGRAGATVVTAARRGYGWACATGGDLAVSDRADIIVYIDGDGSSRPDEISALIQPIIDGRADLVLGSRVLGTIEPGAMAPHQRFGNRLTAWLIRRLHRVPVTDLGPYRAIRTDLLDRLDMEEMTFGWPTEMTVKCALAGATIVEVPVTWQARGHGSSKVSGTVKGSMLAARLMLGVTLRSARWSAPTGPVAPGDRD